MVTEMDREIPLTLTEYNNTGRQRTDFYYVYRVTGREDGMEYAFAHPWHSGYDLAHFRLAADAQAWVDHLRNSGNVVSVMPSAEGILT